MSIVIRANNLSKDFRAYRPFHGFWGHIRSLFYRPYDVKRVVDSVSFDVEEGELIGYIGPNGAGKSTTIKMLTGILVPSDGEVEVLGKVPWQRRQELAQEISVVFGQRQQTWWELPLRDSLLTQRYIYRLPEERFQRTLGVLTELLGLDEFIDTPVRQLSLGQRMRGEVAMALLHEPRILYLDEPTIGMDIMTKEKLRQFIQTLNSEFGVTVMLTTHDMGDVERLCRRVLLIDHGRILYDGALADLRARYGRERRLVLEFERPVDRVEVSGAQLESHEGLKCRIRFDRREISASELIGRLTSRYPVRDLSVEEPEIETVIQAIYAEAAKTRESTA